MLTFSKPTKYKATVIEKKQLNQTVFMARYQLVEPATIDFHAGQTLMLTVSPGIFRAMSIASPPQENTVITSIQDTTPNGPGSKWMLARKVGDPVEFMAPLGRFVVDHDSPRKKVFIATGTGIAPFRSMLLDTSDNRIVNETISLYWGLRFKEDMYLCQDIEKFKQERGNMGFYFTLSKPPDDWTGLVGHVTEHVLNNEQNLKECDFYLCGNKKMITEIQEKLTAFGVPREQMKFDPFF